MRRAALGMLFVGLMIVSSEVARPAHSEPAYLYTAAKEYDPLAWMHGGERFASGASVFIHDASGNRALAPGFSASADPSVSFDAKRVLFAGKKTSHDHWQIWELELDARHPKQITNCSDDCVRPFYLPGERIVYAQKADGKFAIQTAALDGTSPLSLTYNPASSFPTDVLRDGRILFEAAYRDRETEVPEIYTVYSDGSGVESYRCDHGTARHSGKQVGPNDVVFAQPGGLARFTSALGKEISVSGPPGDYAGDVAENGMGEWLLPWRSNPRNPFQLMWWKPGERSLRPALKDQQVSLLQPAFLAERVVPRKHPSGLHDWQVGNLLCLNAYTSKFKFADASIHSVRLYTKDAQGVRLLGTTAVEADGSFYVQVRGDQPLQIEILDQAGQTLKREQGWFWIRRGEQRVCVGCHAGPETAPENAVPMALTKSTTPADMTGAAKASLAGGH